MRVIELPKKDYCYIWGSKVLLGSELKLSHNLLLVIKNFNIEAILQMSRDEAQEAFGDKICYIVDESICLLPGFIDAHLHLALDGNNFQEALSLWEHQELLEARIQKDLESLQKHGIVAIRDGGDKGLINLKIKELLKTGCLKGPILVATGQAIRKVEKYGSFLGTGITSLKEIEEFIAAGIKLGIDQLKVLQSGIVSFKEFAKVGSSQFTYQELQFIVNCAHSFGVKVMTHASSNEAAAIAIEAGVDSLEHGYFIESEALQKMADKGIAWVPTIVPVAIQTSEALKREWSNEEIEVIKQTYETHFEKLQIAENLGVCLGLGTDSGASGVRHGESVFRELSLYKEAGLSVSSILKAATLSNAKILGIEKSIGSIDKNKEPRLIGVLGNPLENIDSLRIIEVLFR